MLIGRSEELEYLKGYYEKAGSHLLIFYGQRYIGKTTILREFTRGKPYCYHMAKSCSGEEQLAELGKLRERTGNSSGDKEVIIVEEFHRMVRNGGEVTEALFGLSGGAAGENGVLVILTSPCIGWVENRMVSAAGKAARNISDVFKVRELDFRYMAECFPAYSARQRMEVYGALGGMAGWWQLFSGRCSVKENVCRTVLEGGGMLHRMADALLSEELREPAVYNTILAALASGKEKLNELYLSTGYSRAKLSVYLGNLAEMNWVEKVYSLDTGKKGGKPGAKDGAKKGIYRICNHYVRYYYTYIYGGDDRLFRMSPERYYNTYILPDRDRYMEEPFREICRQHMELCAGRGELPVKARRIGSWTGKTGNIDIVVQGEDGKNLLALCRISRRGISYEEYKGLLETAKKAGFGADYVWLYGELFDERIVRDAEHNGNLTLIDIRDM